MVALKQIESCEVCGQAKLAPVINLGSHPLCDDLVPIGDTRQCELYPIEILYCANCRTAHQRFQIPKEVLFPRTYHYRARLTADVLSGMAVLVSACENQLGSLAGKNVLDVGCNDGSLLDQFSQKGTKTFGIEPTGAYNDALGRGHVLLNDYFSIDTATTFRDQHGCPDVITFTNVFAHIENLTELLSAVRILMAPHTLLVIENHYLGAVLSQAQFDTFYHEHPRTYSFTSFCAIAESLGAHFKDISFPFRYGGNVRVMLQAGRSENPAIDAQVQEIQRIETAFDQKFQVLNKSIGEWKARMSDKIRGLVKSYGPLPAKAFPGRAAILAKLLELDEHLISAVYEKPGSPKVGHFVPGTRIPIRSEVKFFSLPAQPPVLINFAWHIASEIEQYMRKNGFRGDILDIADFNTLGQ